MVSPGGTARAGASTILYGLYKAHVYNISKIRARYVKRTVETSLACASDYALESN